MSWLWDKVKFLLLKWIWPRYIETYPSEVADWELEQLETANLRIHHQFQQLRKRLLRGFNVNARHESDRDLCDIRTQSLSSPPFYQSLEDFIEFNSKDIIDYSKRRSRNVHVFTGTLKEQKKIAIKFVHKSCEIQSDNDLKFAKLLIHPSFVHYLFKLEHPDGRFVLMELYDCSLKKCAKEKINLDLKVALKQICTGLEFLHNSEIFHQSITASNVAVFLKPIQQYKIMNFNHAKETHDQKDFANDIRDLGYMILHLYNWEESQDDNEICMLDNLVDDMNNKDYLLRPSATEVKEYPYLCSPRKILNFIVEISKLIEANNVKFIEQLKRDSKNVIRKDWRRMIDRELSNELGNIKMSTASRFYFFVKPLNSYEFLKNDICSFVKEIRHLIVHNSSEIAKKNCGQTETKLLSYWTTNFPELITHLFKTARVYYANNIK